MNLRSSGKKKSSQICIPPALQTALVPSGNGTIISFILRCSGKINEDIQIDQEKRIISKSPEKKCATSIWGGKQNWSGDSYKRKLYFKNYVHIFELFKWKVKLTVIVKSWLKSQTGSKSNST